MTCNPNHISSKETQISFFRNPVYMFMNKGENVTNKLLTQPVKMRPTRRESRTCMRQLPKIPVKHVRYDPAIFENQQNNIDVLSYGLENNPTLSSTQYFQNAEKIYDPLDISFTDYTSPASTVSPSSNQCQLKFDNYASRSHVSPNKNFFQNPNPSNHVYMRNSFRDAIKDMRGSRGSQSYAENTSSQRSDPPISLNRSYENRYKFNANNQNPSNNDLMQRSEILFDVERFNEPRSRSSGVEIPVQHSHIGKQYINRPILNLHNSLSTNVFTMSKNEQLTQSKNTYAPMDLRSKGNIQLNGYTNQYGSSCTTSTLASPTENQGERYRDFTFCTGASKSTGQASPASIIEELQGRFRNTAQQHSGKRFEVKNQYRSMEYNNRSRITPILTSEPHHQSTSSIPTCEMGGGVSVNFQLSQGFRGQTNGTQNGFLTSKVAPNESVCRPPEALDSSNSSARGGPSFRRLQTLYGTTKTQKRYPSDNFLNKTYLAENYQNSNFISNSKPGTVKIQVRSRSAQASPAVSPQHSPRQVFNSRDRVLSNIVRSQQIIIPSTAIRSQSSPPMSNRNQHNYFQSNNSMVENEEVEKLPSVRDIIRQVEELTQTNSVTLPRQKSDSLENRSYAKSGHQTRTLDRPNKTNTQNGGYLARSYSAYSSQSSPKYNTTQNYANEKYNNSYKPIEFNNAHNGTCLENGNTENMIIPQNGYEQLHTHSMGSQQNAHLDQISTRKSELFGNLPLDYQKLRESFLEQRREVQRLRKELIAKDTLIADLQKDIRLYEPWRC